MTTEEKTKFTPVEAAKYLKMGNHYLDTLRSKKIGPSYYKESGRIYYLKEDLDKYFIEKRKAKRIECET